MSGQVRGYAVGVIRGSPEKRRVRRRRFSGRTTSCRPSAWASHRPPVCHPDRGGNTVPPLSATRRPCCRDTPSTRRSACGGTPRRRQPPDRADGGTILGASVAPCVRSEEHTSELQSLMRISYAVFCLKKKNITPQYTQTC